MTEIIWKDATGYSQGERGKVEPREWECEVLGVRVWVCNGHRWYPGKWVMTCRPFGFDCYEFATKDEIDTRTAQLRALNILRARAMAKAVEIHQLCDAIKEAAQ